MRRSLRELPAGTNTGGNTPKGAESRRLWAARRLALVALMAGGCVSPTTTLQTARTLPPGKVKVIAGASVPVHGIFVETVGNVMADGAHRVADADTEPLTASEVKAMQEASFATVLFQPAMVPEANVRVGLFNPVDIGIRYAGASWRIDGKVNFLQRDDFDLAIVGGYVYHTGIASSIASSVYELFETLHVVDYSRHDFDMALLASTANGKLVTGYGGIRYVLGYASYSTTLPAVLMDTTADAGLYIEDHSTAKLHYLGPTAGVRIGTERIGVLLESAFYWLTFRPTIFGEKRDMDGIVVSPAAALDVQF